MKILHNAPPAATRLRCREHRHGRLLIGMLAGCLLAGASAAAPTPISSLPVVISQPGSYQITRNLTYSGSGDAIQITASNVTLTGGGFTLTGPGDTTDSGSSVGIHVVGAAQVTVTGAKLTAFFRGILLDSGASFDTLTNNSVTGNSEGIRLVLGGHHMLTGNTGSNNGSGIFLDGDTNDTLTSNTASNNEGDGIFVNGASHNNTLHGNVANGNGSYAIRIEGNSNLVESNTASSNQHVGIASRGSGNTLHGNTVSFNHDQGIALFGATGNVVQENNVTDNGVGIQVQVFSGAASNTLVHNTAQRNSTFDLEDDNLSPCQNGWANNLYVTDNEPGLLQGPMFGCIR
jgi:parallel beta-helix repeat protein